MMPVPCTARAHDHLARAVTSGGLVMERAAILERDADHVALGRFGRLADRFGHFARLAMTVADAAALIAHHDEGSEAETPTALHHLGDAVDVHELVDELAVAVSLRAIASFTCHGVILSRDFSVQNSSPPSRAASASAFTRP